MATTRRLTILFSPFAVLCYLPFGAFLLEGYGGKVARSRKIGNTKLHVFKMLALSLKASPVL